MCIQINGIVSCMYSVDGTGLAAISLLQIAGKGRSSNECETSSGLMPVLDISMPVRQASIARTGIS